MEKSFRAAKLVLLIGGWICTAGAASAETKCPGLRALNGQCANVLTVADAQSRAMIVSTVRVSYFGTPIGDIGGPFIPFDKQFQNNPNSLNSLVSGLPTYTFLTPGVGGSNPYVINRTK
jgi:hypothetical protein